MSHVLGKQNSPPGDKRSDGSKTDATGSSNAQVMHVI